MKAAIVTGAGRTPIYGEFGMPQAGEGEELIAVRAAALSPLTRSRAMGGHYSAEGVYPAVAGSEGIGITQDGKRVYFVLPKAPHGAMAEFCPVRTAHCVTVPEQVDDVTAAAIANPGMSGWAALVERAKLQRGETVLVNGATGAAGKLAVQLAKHLGAGRVIATGRNEAHLETVRELGADEVIRFALDEPTGAQGYERALQRAFATGVDVVVDYLWGASAKAAMVAIAKTVEDARPVRFVQVGAAGGEETLEVPAAALRSSAIVLMGSGLKSVRLETLLAGIGKVFEAVQPAGLRVDTTAIPLREVERVWVEGVGRKRAIFIIGE